MFVISTQKKNSLAVSKNETACKMDKVKFKIQNGRQEMAVMVA